MSKDYTRPGEEPSRPITEAAAVAGLMAEHLMSTIDDGGLTRKILVKHATGEIIDLEPYLPFPSQIRQAPSFTSLDSFVAYVARFKDCSTIVMVRDEAPFSLRAFLEYHFQEEDRTLLASWCTHTATYDVPFSLEYAPWRASDGKGFSQQGWHTFVEEHVQDIVGDDALGGLPSAARMLEIAGSIEAKKGVTYKASERKHDGSFLIHYEESVAGAGGVAGKLAIPTTFQIAVPLFKGGDAIEVLLRFRFQLVNSQILLRYEIANRERIERDAFTAAIKDAQVRLDVPFYAGVMG